MPKIEIPLSTYFDIYKNKFKDEEFDLKTNINDARPIKTPLQVKLVNDSPVHLVDIRCAKSGHGYVNILESYVVNYKEVEYFLISFEYELVITDRFSVKVHYHPDSTHENHVFVHLHIKPEHGKDYCLYLNPYSALSLSGISSPNIVKNIVWNSSYSWANIFMEMFNSYQKNHKTVKIEDCLNFILSKK